MTEAATTPVVAASRAPAVAALAARDIGFHVMGYFPITPSTEVAENLSKMHADGEHEIMMIAGDGEHGGDDHDHRQLQRKEHFPAEPQELV